MKNLFYLAILTFLFSCAGKAPSGETQRIISLAPNITEILFSLGVQGQIVGVSDYCNFPVGAKEKESIGGLFNPNLEKITALKPDLILATESYKNLAEKLGKDRFRIVLLPEKTVDDIYLTIDSIGVLTGTSLKAKKMVSDIRDSLDFYRSKSMDITPEAILVLGRDAGTTRNIGISGPGAFINELWVWTGGRNSFPDLDSPFVQINREDLLHADPEIIIEFKSNKNWGLSEVELNKEEWGDLQVPAVKNNTIFVITGNHFLIPGPRMYLLAKEYHKILEQYHIRMLE
ncbi:MAG: ABC transporter substrate-binding protein [Calditrichaeota bacterium]|nr:ABC transporter substrate-binding protein [Calditrichota bacterium]